MWCDSLHMKLSLYLWWYFIISSLWRPPPVLNVLSSLHSCRKQINLLWRAKWAACSLTLWRSSSTPRSTSCSTRWRARSRTGTKSSTDSPQRWSVRWMLSHAASHVKVWSVTPHLTSDICSWTGSSWTLWRSSSKVAGGTSTRSCRLRKLQSTRTLLR